MSATSATALVKENFEKLSARIAEAARRAGRLPSEVTLVAVTKGVDVPAIQEAQQCGVRIFAENRVQDAQEKVPQVPGAEWHMVGHLQTNKIKTALGLFQCVQSIDSVRLAEEVNAHLLPENRVLPVLLEVNISGEKQKFGFEPERVYSAVDEIKKLTQLNVQGLMGIAPNTEDNDARRAAFKKLRGVFTVLKSMKSERFQMTRLSMGMSDDFEIAIEEGSNMVRIGRALFGKRPS
jgi:pyridoxal phosphate enzyme (YggS family)